MENFIFCAVLEVIGLYSKMAVNSKIFSFIVKNSPSTLPGFSFTNIHDSKDSRERGRLFFKSSLPLPPASQTPRH